MTYNVGLDTTIVQESDPDTGFPRNELGHLLNPFDPQTGGAA